MDPDRARRLNRVEHGGHDDPDVLDLSANVNARTPAGVESVYREALASARRYPAEPPGRYRQVAAEYVDCDPEQVIPTPGGLAAIRLAIALTVEAGDTALVPAPSFGSYAREVRLQGGEPAFRDPDTLLDADPAGHALAIVCTPNNPTGWLPDRRRLVAFADRCRAADTPLLLDEAFLGFTDRATLAGRPGVIVARSLTKLFGLPGLRMGFAVASDDLQNALVGARRPWNLGTPALAVGAHCLRQDEFVAETRARVDRERERLREGLPEWASAMPSRAPFVLCEVGERGVDRVLDVAEREGVALRDARTFRGLDSHVRIAVRDRAATDRTLEVFERV